ncbi:hypothetical protein [Massilia aerilata]|uniref:HEAT repeat domain-containing protein n=1 Tax=Massilia aerilata TaxID=453817 RepID=A0ABW0S5F4_9BURK
MSKESFSAELNAWFTHIANEVSGMALRRSLNLLDTVQSAALTQDLSFHPLVATLGGIALDDPETSNFHLYLTRSPLSGGIFYLSHDGDSRLVFPSVDTLLAAAREASLDHLSLDELHPPSAPLAQDQAALEQFIASLLDAGEDDDLAVIIALIPSLALADLPLLERLATHEDFFVAEALADAITERPAAGLRDLAERCSRHPHPQAAQAGARALAAVDNALPRPIE